MPNERLCQLEDNGGTTRRRKQFRRRRVPRVTALAAACVAGCMAILFAVSIGTAVSGASFLRTTSNPGNVFTAGSFSLLNSVDRGYVVDATGLRPGQSVAGTLTLTCQGGYAGAATMTNGGITNSPVSPALSAVLTLTIENITGSPQTLWSGTMSTFTSLALGQFSAGQVRTYRFTVTFPPAAAVPALQGASSTLLVTITGVAQ